MSESTPSRFSNSGEVEQISEYRKFNLLAIIAAVLGFASVGLLVSPFLVILPLLAIFLGACGLAAYHRRDDLGGRVPSWIGIVLALFFISWTASEFLLTRCVFYSEAYGVVDDWLGLVVNGEREIAHQAMMNIGRRQATGLSVDEYYSVDEEARKAMDEVFAEEPMATLITLGKDTDVRLMKNVSLVHDLNNSMMEQVYRLTPADGDPIDVKVTTTRRFNASIEKSSWIVSAADFAKETNPNIAEKISSLVTSFVAR